MPGTAMLRSVTALSLVEPVAHSGDTLSEKISPIRRSHIIDLTERNIPLINVLTLCDIRNRPRHGATPDRKRVMPSGIVGTTYSFKSVL